MKKRLFLITFILSALSIFAADFQLSNENWTLNYKERTKTMDVVFKGKSILLNFYPLVKCNGADGKVLTLKPDSYTSLSIKKARLSDTFGTGTKYTFLYTRKGLPSLRQLFFMYNHVPWFLTEVALESKDTIYSNYLSPITSTTSSSFLTKSTNNRMLMVPWDNDGWVRFESNALTKSTTSYEVTSVYSGEDRSGLVVGSVEHDTWKSGIKITASEDFKLDSIRCFSGISSALTRDVLPHGKVKGKTVKSAKMFVGFFEDWRTGMETYGRANTNLAPSRTWNLGTPFGWNSWGVMADKVTYAGAKSVSDFYKDSLYSKGFHNDSNVVIIDLDSFWDNMTEIQLKDFAEHCRSNGQIPGIYWCPFSDWGSDGERFVEGTKNLFKYKDCYLYINGAVHSQGGRCLDPTHPATKARIKYQIEKFKEWGFRYIKLDFITNGAIQGDSYFIKQVTTGTQAYNEGLHYLTEVAGDDVFLALSIAPIFPYQYGNSRRMSCDSWADIGDFQYVMNALSYGWWMNQFYQYNDPDHLVLQKGGTESMGVNRARVTTGAICGMFMFGDNFSLEGPEVGFPLKSRERALSLMTNPDINEIARIGKSFKPVEGCTSSFNGAENLFMYQTNSYFYLACINYGADVLESTLTLERLGLNAQKAGLIKELWTQTEVKLQHGKLFYQVPASDARIYRISKKIDRK